MKKALIVCNSNYIESSAQLKGGENDAALWKSLLSDRWKYETDTQSDLIYEKLKKAIGQFVTSLTNGDVGVLVYSGHGSRRRDFSIFHNPFHEGIVGTDGYSLFDNEMDTILDNLDNGARLCIFYDCCHAQGMVLPYALKITRDYDSEQYSKRKTFPLGNDQKIEVSKLPETLIEVKKRVFEKKSTNIIVLSACSKYEFAYERSYNEEVKSVFSYHGTTLLSELPKDANFAHFVSKLRQKIEDDDIFEQTPKIYPQKSDTIKIREFLKIVS